MAAHYQEPAKRVLLTTSLASQVAAFGGSLVFAGGISLFDPPLGTVGSRIKDFLSVFCIYSAFSWVVITPVCLFLAMPLKLMVRPRWGWLKQTLLCALVGGALGLLVDVALRMFSEYGGADHRLSTAAAVFGIGAYYAAVFGLAEWWLTRRLESKGTVAGELPVKA